MKSQKIALLALVGSLTASSAFADVTYHIYGSTAYRKATISSITALYGTGLTLLQGDNGAGAVVTGASVPNNSTNLIWKGTMAALGGQNVIIYANWAGSTGGVQATAGKQTVTVFLKDGGAYGTYSSGIPDLCMTDGFQDSTPYTSATPGYEDLNSEAVAIIEFIWAKGNGSPASLVNVNDYSLAALLSNGSTPVSQFSGVTSDATNVVFVTGRNDNSGTRTVTLTDCLYGAGTSVTQYAINTPYAYVPFGPGPNFDGDGYDSGGSVANGLALARPASYHGPGTTNESYIIGYVGLLDAVKNGTTGPTGAGTLATVTGALVPPSQWLTYNGQPWSEAAIQEGAYSFFAYEHCNYRNSDATPTLATFATALRAQLVTQAGIPTLPGTMQLSAMKIVRTDDGGAIAHD